MKIQLIVVAVGMVLPLAVAPAMAQQPYLSKLKITGAEHVGRGEIKSVMTTNAPSLWSFLPFTKLPVFDRAVMNDDIGRIQALYESYGYYHARVHYTSVENKKKRMVAVTIIVSEGVPTRVDGVVVHIVSEEIPVVEPGIRNAILLKRGEVFRVEFYDKTKQRLEQYLGDHGYPDPVITGKVVVDQQRYGATITFDITTGARRVFDEITVQGNRVVSKEDILREVRFKKGGTFSRAVLADSQRNIFRLGLFNAVVVTPQTDREKEVPVEITVEEKPLHTMSLGAGYGSEDKVRAQAAWTRRYLWGTPRTLVFNAFYSSLLINGGADLSQPYFIDHDSNLGIHAGYTRDNYVSYSNESISTQARVGRVFSRRIEGYVSYNLEVNRPISVSRVTVESLTGTHPGDYYYISGMFFDIRYDTVKDNLYPLYGSVFSLFVEPATYLLGSKVDYLRVIGEGRIFYPVAKDNVLALRVKAGMIEPMQDTTVIPIFKRFFAGGSNSVRGYAFQSLGPTDASGTPVGGDFLLEGSLEARYPVWENVKGVVFMDAGNVFQERISLNSPDLKYSAGVGGRYITVVGPVRVDIAFPLDPFPRLAWDRYSVYLSLGNAF